MIDTVYVDNQPGGWFDPKSWIPFLGIGIAITLYNLKNRHERQNKAADKAAVKAATLYLIRAEIQWNQVRLEKMLAQRHGADHITFNENLKTNNKDALWHIVMGFMKDYKYGVLNITRLYDSYEMINRYIEGKVYTTARVANFPWDSLQPIIDESKAMANKLAPLTAMNVQPVTLKKEIWIWLNGFDAPPYW